MPRPIYVQTGKEKFKEINKHGTDYSDEEMKKIERSYARDVQFTIPFECLTGNMEVSLSLSVEPDPHGDESGSCAHFHTYLSCQNLNTTDDGVDQCTITGISCPFSVPVGYEIRMMAGHINILDLKYIAKEFEKYPSVQESILGALERFRKDDFDSKRHCIISCRAAIENLCIELGKNPDWKKSLSILCISDTDQNQVKHVWNFLSGKGIHGGHSLTRQEVEYSLQLTIATLRFIFQKKF